MTNAQPSIKLNQRLQKEDDAQQVILTIDFQNQRIFVDKKLKDSLSFYQMLVLCQLIGYYKPKFKKSILLYFQDFRDTERPPRVF